MARSAGTGSSVGLGARVVAAARYLPPRIVTSAEIDGWLAEANPCLNLRPGLIEAASGVRERRYCDEGLAASDLAVEAARDLFRREGIDPCEIDLLIYASATKDMIEPATSHIVQQKLGTKCQVFDITNACNSFINGMQVAEALIMTGRAANVLVVAGETPSRIIRWRLSSVDQFRSSFMGYTVGDAGAAALMRPATDGRGVFYRGFDTDSSAWPLMTVPGGGSAHLRDPERLYVEGDASQLRKPFMTLGPGVVRRTLEATGTTFDDYAVFCIHQVSAPMTHEAARVIGIPEDRIITTLPVLGNIAAATLPTGLSIAVDEGRLRPGDLVMLVGLAAGIELGAVALRW